MLDKIDSKTKANLSDLANKIYDDGLKKTVQATGDCIALIPKAIKAALEPIEQIILYKEYNLAVTKKMLAEKLDHIDSEDIVPPEPHIAIPAIDAISYCINSNELRNLYANLIARSMLKNQKDNVHPAFVEIIKQLSPTDAAILKNLYNQFCLSVPLVSVNLRNIHKNEYISVIKNVCRIHSYSYPTIATTIENLNRLKLFDIVSNVCFSDITEYDSIINSPDFMRFLNQRVLHNSDYKFDFIKSVSQPTEFGLAFCNICIKDL